MHEGHAVRRTPARDHARRLRIGDEGGLGILLGTINRRVGGRVDHHRWLQAIQQGWQAVGLAEISHLAGAAIRQLTTAGGGNHFTQRRQRAQQLLANLAIATEHQNGHGT